MAASGPYSLCTLSFATVDDAGPAKLILESLNHRMSQYLPESPLEPANISLLVASGTLLGIRVGAFEAPALAELRVEGMPR